VCEAETFLFQTKTKRDLVVENFELAQVTPLQENRKFLQYQISDWGPSVRLVSAKHDVVKTYPLAWL
jgi:hypothetical protein